MDSLILWIIRIIISEENLAVQESSLKCQPSLNVHHKARAGEISMPFPGHIQRTFWCEVSSNLPDPSSKQNFPISHKSPWLSVDCVTEESLVPSRSYPLPFFPIHSQETQVEVSL